MGTPTYLHLRDYQRRASATAFYPGKDGINGLAYAALGLNGEAGEVAEKVKKALRDDHGIISEERRIGLKKELGDVLWYLAQACTELGLHLEDVAEANLAKLADRDARGVRSGSGDDR
jgi:NTP pyrophosphatase (non-canonical NTP hydrolase)